MKKIKVLLMAAVFMILLAACSSGSTVTTTLTFNEDMSGTRVMEVAIAQDVFDEYFTGTIDELTQVLTTAAPQVMSVAYVPTETENKYQITIAFSSVDDYIAQMNSLFEEPQEIVIATPDSVLADGVSIEESFSTSDILGWMSDAIVNAGFVDSSNSSNIFDIGETVVVKGENIYSASDRISISEVNYTEITSIDIYTEVHSYEEYSRSIVISIPSAAMTLKADDIKAYFASLLPSEATGEWETVGTEEVYTVSIANVNIDGLNVFTASVLDNDLGSIVLTEEAQYSPFSFSENVTEILSFAMFASGSGNTSCEYWLKYDEIYSVYGVEMGNVENDNTAFADYGLYDSVSIGTELREFNYDIEKNYEVSGISVELDQSLFTDEMTRTTTVTFAEMPSEADEVIMVTAVQNRVPGVEVAEIEEAEEAEEVEEVEEVEEEADEAEEAEEEADEEETSGSVEITSSVGDTFVITVVQKGTDEEITESSNAIFGGYNELICSGEENHILAIKHDMVLSDTYDYSSFVYYYSDDFEFAYSADPGLFGKAVEEDEITEDSTWEDLMNWSYTTAEIVDGRIVPDYTGMTNSVLYFGTYVNVIGVAFWALIVIIVIIVIFILFKTGVIKTSKKKQVGYDAQGYQQNGYDAQGYQQNGYDAQGYQQNGYDAQGYQQNGYDAQGYQQNGYDAQGYQENGYDAQGYQENGYVAPELPQYGYGNDEIQNMEQPYIEQPYVEQPYAYDNQGMVQQEQGTSQFCSSCGASVEAGTLFCEVCGNKMS